MTVTKIALVGKLRSGKDTAANYASLFYDFKTFAFGDELKRFFHEIYPYVPRDPKPRAQLQKFGQMLRELDKSVWINATMQKIDRHVQDNRCAKCECPSDARIIITDCRQENEYERLKAEGYVFIKVTAPDDIRIARALEAGDDFTVHDLAHETERMIDTFEYDFELTNDRSTTEIYEGFDAIMRELGVSRTV